MVVVRVPGFPTVGAPNVRTDSAVTVTVLTLVTVVSTAVVLVAVAVLYSLTMARFV